MSNEETGKLIDLIKKEVRDELGWELGLYDDDIDGIAIRVTGELQSRYRIEPLENTVEEEATK